MEVLVVVVVVVLVPLFHPARLVVPPAAVVAVVGGVGGRPAKLAGGAATFASRMVRRGECWAPFDWSMLLAQLLYITKLELA